LVHDVFLGTGFIRPERSGLRLRIFETTSETATFIARANGRIVGVLSVVGDSADLGLPSDSAFKVELDRLRTTGARLCEVTNQAVADEFRKSAVSTELMRCAVTHAMKAGFNEGIATVSPSHNGFYDLLGFRQLGSERSYSNKLHDPVVALSMDINRFRQPPADLDATQLFIQRFMNEGNRFLTRVTDWAKVARRHFLNPELLEQLFVTESNFLAECTATELRILHRRWGQEMFEAVTANLFTSVDGLLAEMLEFPAISPTEHPAQQLHAVGTSTPFPSHDAGSFSGLSGNLHRFASAARDHITTPFLNLLNWSDEQMDLDSDPAPLRFPAK
jgi:ribosomal protein S18 acetylase RimI-like enzyme